MKKMIKLMCIAIISLTSVFFVLGGKTEVYAKSCNLGEYYDVQAKSCKESYKANNQKDKVTNIGKAFEYFAYTIIYLSVGLALIMILYAGFSYTMSEGDPKKILEAKNMMLKAGIGMLVAFSAHNIMGLFDAFGTL